jgi:hypothetical protein
MVWSYCKSRRFIAPALLLLAVLTCLAPARWVKVSAVLHAAPPQAATIAPHPRIFLTPAFLNQLKARAAANSSDWLALKASADSYANMPVPPFARSGGTGITYDYEGYGWLTAIQALGLAYQITGDTRYSNQVIAILNAINAPYKTSGDVSPISIDSGYPSRSAAFGAALAYDWVYDQLTPSLKADTYTTLNAWFDWYKSNAYEAFCPAYSNYFGGHILGFGTSGLATQGDNPRSAEINAFIQNLYTTQMNYAETPGPFYSCSGYQTTAGGMTGGYPVESFNYGPPHHERLLEYVWAVQTATGQTLPNYSANYAMSMARNLLYTTKPDRWRSTDEGDFPGDISMMMPRNLPPVLALLLQGTTEGQWMQFYANQMATPPSDVGTAYYALAPYMTFLYGDPSRPALDYRTTQPTYYFSPGDSHMYMRSDWTDNAVYASYAAGSSVFGGHESKKAGHLSIQRGSDYLLVNSGQWKGSNGYEGNPQAFDLASWRANTLFFNDFGDYLSTDDLNRGGQNAYAADNILASELTANYVYAKSDFTSVYDQRPDTANTALRTLRSFQRSFVQVGGNKFVLLDRVTALKSNYVKQLYFHFNPVNQPPAVSGTTVRTQVGSSALFVKTLLPANPSVSIAGDGVSSYTDSTRGTWREQVTDANAGTQMLALHALLATDSGVTAMPATSLLVSNDHVMQGAVIQESAGASVVLFSADGSTRRGVTYQAAVTGTASHLIVDMQPGAYDVCRSGSLLGQPSASDQGVLYFHSTGGGTFEVVRVNVRGRSRLSPNNASPCKRGPG